MKVLPIFVFAYTCHQVSPVSSRNNNDVYQEVVVIESRQSSLFQKNTCNDVYQSVVVVVVESPHTHTHNPPLTPPHTPQNFPLLLNELSAPTDRRVRATVGGAAGLSLFTYLLIAQAAYWVYGSATAQVRPCVRACVRSCTGEKEGRKEESREGRKGKCVCRLVS